MPCPDPPEMYEGPERRSFGYIPEKDRRPEEQAQYEADAKRQRASLTFDLRELRREADRALADLKEVHLLMSVLSQAFGLAVVEKEPILEALLNMPALEKQKPRKTKLANLSLVRLVERKKTWQAYTRQLDTLLCKLRCEVAKYYFDQDWTVLDMESLALLEEHMEAHEVHRKADQQAKVEHCERSLKRAQSRIAELKRHLAAKDNADLKSKLDEQEAKAKALSEQLAALAQLDHQSLMTSRALVG